MGQFSKSRRRRQSALAFAVDNASRRPTPRRLRVEPLESRQLLAVLGLDIQLLADDNGQPGAEISQPEQLRHGPVQVNDEFWVRVTAWDQRDPQNVSDPAVAGDETPGVIGLPLNLAWDPTVLSLLSPLPAGTAVSDDASNPESRLVSLNFPLSRELGGFHPAADAAACDGLSDPASCNLAGLQGGALPALGLGQQIGSDGPEEFSLLRFRALAPDSQSPFLLQLGGAMSFADGAALDNVAQLVNGQLSPGDMQNRVVELLEVAAAPADDAAISGFVYADTDLDGVFDTAEIGLPNVTVQLFEQGGTTALVQTTTGPDGFYLFDGLAPGTYTVVERQNADFVNSINTLGVVLPGGLPSGVVGDDQFSEIVLAAGEQAVDYNFGDNLRAVNKRMFLGGARPRDVLCEHLGVSCVTVEGTAADDTIQFDVAGSTLRVTVNGQPPRTFSQADVDIVTIDAGAGRDSVTLIGTDQDETAHLTTRRTSLRGTDYGVLTENAETTTAEGRGGDDLAVISDAAEDETLTADGDAAELLAPTIDLLARARFFEQVRANSVPRAAADTDTLALGAPLYVLTPLGKWIVV